MVVGSSDQKTARLNGRHPMSPGYLNDVAQPMMDEISPKWAWPMKLRTAICPHQKFAQSINLPICLARIHLEDVIVWGPNATQKSALLGFNAHQGAQVPVDLKIVVAWLRSQSLQLPLVLSPHLQATPEGAQGNIWMNWYVAPATCPRAFWIEKSMDNEDKI